MKKTQIDISVLDEALKTLREGYNLYLDNKGSQFDTALQDSCIKRFEYTYETVKKIMNKYLKYEFDKTDLPINNVFREVYGLGLIEDYERWVGYRVRRNDTSHEYNLVKAREIIEILDSFIKDVDYFLTNLKKSLSK